MKIHEIRVLIEPNIYNDNFFTIWARVYPEYKDVVNVQMTYPLDYLTSLFDKLWEDIGKELKKGLLESENDS
jgi:hypothetical protein